MIEFHLDQIALLANQQREDTRAFIYYVHTMWDQEGRSDDELDALVEHFAADVIPQIDCTTCANCCRSLPLGLTPSDIPHLAQALHLPEAQVLSQYVDVGSARDPDEWALMRGTPCPLLHNNLCTIYPHRPHACRLYPWLTPDFRWTMHLTLEGAGTCPIIFHVMEELKRRLGW